MDGNGRWARRRGKERYEGHIAGVDALRATVINAAEYGVRYLTVYAFSTENWGRPQQEVEALMHLICKGVEMETPALVKQGVRVRILGDKSLVRILRMRNVPFIDTTGLHNLEIFLASSAREGIEVILSGVNEKVYDSLEKGGIAKFIKQENICGNIREAVALANSIAERSADAVKA